MAISKSLTAAAGCRFAAIGGFFALVVGFAGPVMAGQPTDWRTGFQPAASPTMERIEAFNDILFVIITLIVAFVLALLVVTMWKFSEKRNPTPSRTTHNTLVEVLWTVIPVIILVVIAIPSFKLLYFADRVEEADMTVKAIGRQWYWSYEYPDQGDFTFDAYMLADDELEDGQPRLLTTDNAVVLPVDTKIRLLITASDVIHSFAMPSMGIKLDAVPGRLNETWVEITREGMYYGQCSEICGTGHSFMPIMIKAVSKADFAAWVDEAKQEFGALEDQREGEEAPLRLAEAAKDKGKDD